MTEEDLRLEIESEVAAAHRGVVDARAARELAEHQLEIARDTQALAQASEQAGAATNLQVLDANTMVAASEAQLHTARLRETVALLELLSACGGEVPTGGPPAPEE